MKLENNWKSKTLENLEKDVWMEQGYTSRLMATCHRLRKKLLKDFAVEDLRVMIGQNIGLNYLIPLAIEELRKDILVEGNLYKGDLLMNILKSEIDYWKIEKENWLIIINLFQSKVPFLMTFDTTKEIRSEWFKSFEEFEKIHA